MNRWALRQAGRLLRALDWLERWLIVLRCRVQRRARIREADERLIGLLDDLEGRYTLLVNDLPLDPRTGFGPGDRLTILGSGPEEEMEMLRTAWEIVYEDVEFRRDDDWANS